MTALLLLGLAILPVGHARAATPVMSIRIINFRYSDPDVTVDLGATVEWKVDQGDHTATSLGTEFDSDAMDTDSDPYRHTFNRPGIYHYRCQFHEVRGMTGVITVNDPSGSTPTTEAPTTTTTLPPYTTTTTTAPTTSTATPATTPTTTLTQTSVRPPDPPADPEPTTTAPPAPSSTTAPTAKGSSSTTAPAPRSRSGSAAAAATPVPASPAPVSPAPVSSRPPQATATPPPESSSSSSVESASPTSTAPGPIANFGVPPEPAGAKDDQNGDGHGDDWLFGLVAVSGVGYGLWRWLTSRS